MMMVGQGKDVCSASPHVNPPTPPNAKSFTVDDILGDSVRNSVRKFDDIDSSEDRTQSFSTYPNISTQNCGARTVVSELPAWIYATRYSRQGLPPGYNVRRSQKPSREKKVRQIFSTKQVEWLEQEFTKNRYVTALKREELASVLNLTETQIRTWFQNRRTKWRKEIRAEIVGNKPGESVWTNSRTSLGITEFHSLKGASFPLYTSSTVRPVVLPSQGYS